VRIVFLLLIDLKPEVYREERKYKEYEAVHISEMGNASLIKPYAPKT